MLAKATIRGADALILDLEDAVAFSRKDQAREAALDMAATTESHSEIWLRVNDGDLGERDLAAVVGAPGVAGVWLAKAEPGPWLDRALGRLREANTRVGLMIESARAVARLAEFPELGADTLMQIGEADLAADLRSAGDREQLSVYRSMVVLECAARGIAPPVAPVSVNVTDMVEFRDDSERMANFGFRGRACVHPAQVAVANDVWGVSEQDVARARGILAEFEAHTQSGVGVFRGTDGTMVDRATVRWAHEVLESYAR
jgi:citrate lyase subunit beta/citryl-CoA lyase